jgi:hypothetical protein
MLDRAEHVQNIIVCLGILHDFIALSCTAPGEADRAIEGVL